MRPHPVKRNGVDGVQVTSLGAPVEMTAIELALVASVVAQVVFVLVRALGASHVAALLAAGAAFVEIAGVLLMAIDVLIR